MYKKEHCKETNLLHLPDGCRTFDMVLVVLVVYVDHYTSALKSHAMLEL